MDEVKKPVKGGAKAARETCKEITRKRPVSPELRELLTQKEPESKNKRSAKGKRDVELS